MTNEERIKADAEAYANGIGDVYRKYASLYGYIAGATVLHDFATPLYEALLELFALKELKEKHGKTPEYLKRQPIAWQKAKEALNKWKGREVEPKEQQPDLGTCVECGIRKAVADYNGHQYHVCDPCNNRLNREFDKEYN